MSALRHDMLASPMSSFLVVVVVVCVSWQCQAEPDAAGERCAHSGERVACWDMHATKVSNHLDADEAQHHGNRLLEILELGHCASDERVERAQALLGVMRRE